MNNSYTDAPSLHPNVWVGSLQLLIWLVFHPSAWRNHVKRIDPNLPSNFCLLQLEPEHWRNPLLRKLLVIGYVVWPIWLGLLISIASWLLGLESVWTGIVFGMGIGIIVGLFIGVVLGFNMGLISLILGWPIFSVAPTIAAHLFIDGVFSQTDMIIVVVINTMAFNLFGSCAGAIANNLVNQKLTYRLSTKAGSAIVGMLVSALAYFIGPGLTINMEGKYAHNLVWAGLPNLTSNWVNTYIICATFSVIVFIGLSGAGILNKQKWEYSFLFGMVGGGIGGVTLLIINGNPNNAGTALLAGLSGGTWFAAVFVFTYALANFFAGPQSGAIAGTFGVALSHTTFLFIATEAFHWVVLPISLICAFIGLTLTYWLPIVMRPGMEAIHLILYQTEERQDNSQLSFLRFHSEFWNELQRKTSATLKDHLILVASRNPDEGQAAIDYLSTTRHRQVAQEAQVEVDIYRLELCLSVEAISQVYAKIRAPQLLGAFGKTFQRFYDFSRAVEGALDQITLLDQEDTLRSLAEKLLTWRQELIDSTEPYAARFQVIVRNWQQIVADQADRVKEEAELQKKIKNPYRPALPLEEEHRNIFASRDDVVARIEQLLLDPRRPPLLLYGQRRMGKTSLLKNLGRLLRSKMTAVPMLVDGQALKAGNLSALLAEFSSEMRRSAQEARPIILPEIDRATLQSSDSPLLELKHWFEQIEISLREQGYTIGLLMLDELEFIKDGEDKGRFKAIDFLDLLRNTIQHRPFFKLLFAASHGLREFDQWASQLINTQVIKISYLTESEARRLIERPEDNFPLHYEPATTQRILDLTRGHPHLVQALCYELVSLKNSQEDLKRRRHVSVEDIEAAAVKALGSNYFFFSHIEHKEIDLTGRKLLKFMAAQGEGAVVGLDFLAQQIANPQEDLVPALDLLGQRDLIEAVNGGYRFEVEMIRRWFAPARSKL